MGPTGRGKENGSGNLIGAKSISEEGHATTSALNQPASPNPKGQVFDKSYSCRVRERPEERAKGRTGEIGGNGKKEETI